MIPAEILMSRFKGSQRAEHRKVPLSALREPREQWEEEKKKKKNWLIKYKWPITPLAIEAMGHCSAN